MYPKKVTFFITALLISWLHFAYADNVLKQNNDDAAMQQAVLFYINEYRHQHGLPALQMNDHMVKEARQHSQDMAHHKIPFGHKDFEKRMNTLHAEITNSNAGAENVAFNYKNAQDVVKNWLKSPGHKKNIDGHYNLTGIGIARDQNGKIYFTQMFLKTDTAHVTRGRPITHWFAKQ